MNELQLSLENINPVVLWGPNNEYFEIIKKHFPKLKIVARGSEVKVLGDETELAAFGSRFTELVSHIEKFQTLSGNDLDHLLGTKINGGAVAVEDVSDNPGNGGEAIVFAIERASCRPRV